MNDKPSPLELIKADLKKIDQTAKNIRAGETLVPTGTLAIEDLVARIRFEIDWNLDC